MSADITITLQLDKLTPEQLQGLCALVQQANATPAQETPVGFAPATAPQAPEPPTAPAAPVTQPTAALPPSVAPTSAPTYTLDQLVTAGAGLLDAGKMQDLVGLLAKYEVQALTQIKPEQYGALAADLRALGARL